jgi:hypothetical protein
MNQTKKFRFYWGISSAIFTTFKTVLSSLRTSKKNLDQKVSNQTIAEESGEPINKLIKVISNIKIITETKTII